MNTPTGPTTVSLESPPDKNPPVAADSATGRMLAEQSIMLKYYGRAQRELYERDRLDDATDKDIEQLAYALRHEDFMRAIEPYQRQRTYIISSWLMLQTRPVELSQLPEPLRNAVADWDEMIAGVARQFGYRPEFGNAPTSCGVE